MQEIADLFQERNAKKKIIVWQLSIKPIKQSVQTGLKSDWYKKSIFKKIHYTK